jgi:hypothetical protein
LVTEREGIDYTVLWNQEIQAHRKPLENKPDIITEEKKDRICLLKTIAIPSDKNVIQKEAEIKLKYNGLSI